MTYEEILGVLSYANGHDIAVHVVTTDGAEVVGVPSSVDTHITAHEVYLRPIGDDETEIALSLGAIQNVELI
ncbi:MAG: hypothetical protein WBC97_07815 [Gemmatimonadales bacterium]